MSVKQVTDFPRLRVGAVTDVGKIRKENQDSMSRFPTTFGEIFIVADGMGGHKGGGLAATMTIEGIESFLKTAPAEIAPQEALIMAAKKTNTDIYKLAHSGNPETEKMGSTLVLALVKDWQVLLGHAGDSRAYLFRNGKLQRLTKDHSLVQKMLDRNMLTEEEARDHPDASVITCAFGQKLDLDLEVSSPQELEIGDGLLLCSDGLCGYVTDPQIEQVISENEGAQDIANALVELALSAGGEDNVTIQYIKFHSRSEPIENQIVLYSKRFWNRLKIPRTLILRFLIIFIIVVSVIFIARSSVVTYLINLIPIKIWDSKNTPKETPAKSPTPNLFPIEIDTPHNNQSPTPKPTISVKPKPTTTPKSRPAPGGSTPTDTPTPQASQTPTVILTPHPKNKPDDNEQTPKKEKNNNDQSDEPDIHLVQ